LKKRGQKGAKRWIISGFRVWAVLGIVCGQPVEAHMTQSADNGRPQLAEENRREIAKRIFDALCAKYPEKYIVLVQPQTAIPAVSSET
jgi:hypothetical protein